MKNQEIEVQLQKWVDSSHVPHSLLFSGSAFSPYETSAINFAKKLINCDPSDEKHPDLYFYKPEGKLGMHSIETMRHLRDEAYLPPYKSKRKVFILFSADRMQAPSANSLLKTFEEPPLTSTIILVSSHPERLLPTVRSRCQAIHFQNEEEKSDKYLPLIGLLLSSMHFMNAIELLDEVAKLADLIEKACEFAEVEPEKEETAYQKQVREKEGEGKESLQMLDETEALFVSIMKWYRDMLVVHLSLPKSALLHPGSHESLQQQVDRGILPDLDKISKVIEKARIALSRSAPLKNTLESLFLSIRTL